MSFQAQLIRLCEEKHISLDPAQARAAQRLETLSQALMAFERAHGSWLKSLFKKTTLPKSLWLYGGVGRGKSFLMDAFFAGCEIERKTRIHFHAFMRGVHEQLKQFKREPDPLVRVARNITNKYRLLCFDEFHVSDIADAMILGRLLEALFERGIVICTTSNYQPKQLYPNGLQRERFLPAIKMIEEKFEMVEVDAGIDYRLRRLTQIETFYAPIDESTNRKLQRAFDAVRTAEPTEGGALRIEGRDIPIVREAGDVVWFEFRHLCEGPRSQVDYLEIARDYHTVIVANVPKLLPEDGNAARRFTLLIDVLYDHAVKIIVSAEVPPAKIYERGPMSHEFARTVSRLIEMQSAEYMTKPHVAAGSL